MIFFMLEERKTIYLCLAHMSEAGFEQKQEYHNFSLSKQDDAEWFASVEEMMAL